MQPVLTYTNSTRIEFSAAASLKKGEAATEHPRACIFKPFKEPRNRFPAWRNRFLVQNFFCRAGPPGYISWRNRFLGSLNVYKYGLRNSVSLRYGDSVMLNRKRGLTIEMGLSVPVMCISSDGQWMRSSFLLSISWQPAVLWYICTRCVRKQMRRAA